ncbi:CDP-glycerol glycerophosphotransferase family protein [Salinicoccus luteus]|uniref:CDP-glycerol glycerophosphotransferase family protein n=1 Tax=Salinicoccus luteus TaxID=367840 RepID=UPI0006906E19|nr:CDP-glycerol glycerophosphotransferase family protein [Salinicoccus luteus]
MGRLKKTLRKIVRKTIPRRVRERLVKKLLMHDITAHEDHITVNLSFKNFIRVGLEKRLQVTLSNDQALYELDYQLHNNSIKIQIPYAIIDQTEGRSTIKMMLGQKRLIVRSDVGTYEQRRSFFSNRRYFNVSIIRGNLSLANLLPEYRFKMDQPVELTHLNGRYSQLELGAEGMDDLAEYELAFFYQSKLKTMDNASDDPSTLQVTDFSELITGRPDVYLLKDFELVPIRYTGPPLSMHTLNHEITYSERDGRLTAEVTSHRTEVFEFYSTVEDEAVRMHFSVDSSVELSALLVVDTSTEETTRIPLPDRQTGDGVSVSVPLSPLITNISRKRFMLETAGAEPIRLQPDISDLETFGFNDRIWVPFHHEKFKIWFYRRRDDLLGFKVTRRHLRRQVTGIQDFSFEGYIGGDEAFIDSTPYMTFVDRYSEDSIRTEISSEFTVDLKTVDLISIKSKDKTIIDVFIEIIHSSGEVLRREKIKYEHSDYRKDNYYDLHEVIDDAGNVHHHLITTTPYNNLKIESFMIPASVDIPEDTSRKDMNIWLLGERYDTAQDNGYALFTWLKENTDINAYYVIEDTAGDYEKIKDEENVLAFGSKQHFDLSFRAGVLLGTHDLENLLPYKTARGFFHYEDTIKVFLQHGVLGRKPVEYDKKYYDLPFDLFIVSSEAEKYDVVMRKMGYEEEEVAVTGLARFDHLPHHNKTKDILLMPTWRDWISTDEAFFKSRYYARYHSLIHNERLNQLLETHDVHLNFYPHYRAQRYFNEEYLDQGENIHFVRLGERTVQDLLIEHSLLITDYSSVSFDFTLMNKPVIYYHFDVRQFFRQGRLRPLYQTFIGDVAKTEEDLVDYIELYIRNHFQPRTVDLSGIFEYQDHNNRRRIYEAVKKKINTLED